jgi:hypothetical protein
VDRLTKAHVANSSSRSGGQAIEQLVVDLSGELLQHDEAEMRQLMADQ